MSDPEQTEGSAPSRGEAEVRRAGPPPGRAGAIVRINATSLGHKPSGCREAKLRFFADGPWMPDELLVARMPDKDHIQAMDLERFSSLKNALTMFLESNDKPGGQDVETLLGMKRH